MLIHHRLGPTTEIPTVDYPAELPGMLLQCEDPRGRWMFVSNGDPEDSKCYYANGTLRGREIDVDFAMKPDGAICGKWQPMVYKRPPLWLWVLRALYRLWFRLRYSAWLAE